MTVVKEMNVASYLETFTLSCDGAAYMPADASLEKPL